MKRCVEGEDRKQAVLLPEYLEDYLSDDNPVRVVDVFVDELDLHDPGFDGTAPAMTGRPSYHPSTGKRAAPDLDALAERCYAGPPDGPLNTKSAVEHVLRCGLQINVNFEPAIFDRSLHEDLRARHRR